MSDLHSGERSSIERGGIERGGNDQRLQPGVVRGRRWHPHYELLGCGLNGHHVVGRDAARVGPEHALVVRESEDGLRWHRCLRCDAWLPLPAPDNPGSAEPPTSGQLQVPLRGKLLRDRYVLRLIALDRLVHFVVLGLLAVVVAVFIKDRAGLDQVFVRFLDAVQGGAGGLTGQPDTGLLHDIEAAFALKDSTLWWLVVALAGYAALEGVEAVGLWMAKRWAEYLTLVATAILLVPEIYELTGRISVLKIVTLVINVAVVVYLLFAKRLFGLRGGRRVEEQEREADTGVSALRGVLPPVPGSAPTPG